MRVPPSQRPIAPSHPHPSSRFSFGSRLKFCLAASPRRSAKRVALSFHVSCSFECLFSVIPPPPPLAPSTCPRRQGSGRHGRMLPLCPPPPLPTCAYTPPPPARLPHTHTAGRHPPISHRSASQTGGPNRTPTPPLPPPPPVTMATDEWRTQGNIRCWWESNGERLGYAGHPPPPPPPASHTYVTTFCAPQTHETAFFRETSCAMSVWFFRSTLGLIYPPSAPSMKWKPLQRVMCVRVSLRVKATVDMNVTVCQRVSTCVYVCLRVSTCVRRECVNGCQSDLPLVSGGRSEFR